MDTGESEKYRNAFVVIRGGKASPVVFRGRRRGRRTRTAAELVLDRRMHTAAVAILGATGTVPSAGWEDIRRGRQHPHRVFARRVIEAHAAGVPVERVLNWIDQVRTWTVQLYQPGTDTITEHVALFQRAVPSRVA